MDHPAFKHKPLDLSKDSIRLLTILRDRSNDGLINCEIRHSTLCSNYICLSYMWGESENEEHILINGQLFRVRSNLWSFLDVAHRKYHRDTFWIDALCIDQDDDPEKGHQVGQMGKIYYRSSKFLIWLGREKFPPEVLGEGTHLPNQFSQYGTRSYASHRRLMSYVSDRKVRQELDRLYTDSYWSRAWIVQEVSLARELLVVHGDQELSWTGFSALWRAMTLVSHSQNRSLIDGESYPASRFIENKSPERSYLNAVPIKKLFYDNPNMKCSQFQDQVYSLLGLAIEGPSIAIDYTISQDALFLQTLRACSTDTCICVMHVLLKALYSVEERSHILQHGGKGCLLGVQHSSTNHAVEILMDRGSQCWKNGAIWSHSDEGGTTHVRASFDIDDCSIFPCVATVTVEGTIQQNRWKCVGLAGSQGKVGEDGCCEIAITGNPTESEGEWRLLLSPRAFVALTIVSESLPHECDASRTKAAYRFIEAGESDVCRDTDATATNP